MRNSIQTNRGQSIVEYILVITFVALAAIAIFRGFRENVGDAYQRAGDALLQGVNESLGDNPDGP